MRKSHLCPSWSAAAAASYGEANFFIEWFVVHPLVADEFLAAKKLTRARDLTDRRGLTPLGFDKIVVCHLIAYVRKN
ncbi:hypothetical protein OUZ56_005940 [Daphnia magna]|uniref:Uncharacterized protein n=1 Tax=Daphnia magna TaxID=35525 RepID=A0ABQ9YU67_9CRUS|nr:hypothetical protein OUZ56_005940 [Daphnia magna]